MEINPSLVGDKHRCRGAPLAYPVTTGSLGNGTAIRMTSDGTACGSVQLPVAEIRVSCAICDLSVTW